MKKKFIDLGVVIKKKCRGRIVYYFPNPGNWGDGLIRHGTLKFFKEINLVFNEVSSLEELDYLENKKNQKKYFRFFKRKSVVIYGGGGAWCELWNHSASYLSNLQDDYNIIVLPSSYETNYHMRNTIFYTRDKFNSHINMPHATFCHDMAFYIGNDFSNSQRGVGAGYFFRTDDESSGQINIPSENFDLSLEHEHLADISPFFEAINQFSVIYTDRLHVSIAAALLKKEVHLYPGSYFKNEAVYLSSLKDYFDNVTFHKNFD